MTSKTGTETDLAPKTSVRTKLANIPKGRAAGFLKTLLSDKRGIIGIGILALMGFVAIAAPLLTPYDPLHSTEMIADGLTCPSWFRYLPGYEKTSENLFPFTDPGFANGASIQDWVFNASSPNMLTLSYISDTGSPKSGPGCIEMVLQRNNQEPVGQIKGVLTREFYYPFLGPPQRYMGQIYARLSSLQNASIGEVEIKVFIQTPNGEIRNQWSAKQGGDYKSGAWITPNVYGDEVYPPLIDSYTLDPLRSTFSEQANYKYGVEVVFSQDIQNASVYLDDLELRLYGTGFGLLGTNYNGLDVFTQLVYGTRISFLVGIVASFISVTLGLAIGLIAAYSGRIVDQILMRLTDMFLVLPELPLLLVIVAVLGPSIWNIIAIIGFLGWMGFARTVRSQALSLRERPFVEAAKAVGAGKSHIIVKHILPNVMNLVYVTLAMTVPGAIMAEAYLSFLGLYDPFVVTWGRMLEEVLYLPGGVKRWWWVLPPGLCIAAISMSFILIGYALDEILNPRLRQRR